MDSQPIQFVFRGSYGPTGNVSLRKVLLVSPEDSQLRQSCAPHPNKRTSVCGILRTYRRAHTSSKRHHAFAFHVTTTYILTKEDGGDGRGGGGGGSYHESASLDPESNLLAN